MNDTRGVTLVEAVTVGIIAAVVGGVTWSFLGMYSGEISDGTIASRMQMQGENIIQQIARDVRRGSLVLDSSETVGASGGDTTTRNIYVWDTLPPGGAEVVAGYSLADSILYEYDTLGDTMKLFFIGEDTIMKVDMASGFHLDVTRKTINADLRIKALYNKKDFLMPVKGSFRCRN
ncbi:MAG: hypothetical protein GF401_08295 [Chitinivibrionales bacterium]|nr:hypothetical protein [Chitinivibrionales bacterium]